MQGSPEARMSHFDQNRGDPLSELSDKRSGQPFRSIGALALVGVIITIIMIVVIFIVILNVTNQHTSLD